MALPLETQLGKAAIVPCTRPMAAGTALPELVTKVPWRNQTDWGKDQAQKQSPSGLPALGPCQGSHFTAQFW